MGAKLPNPKPKNAAKPKPSPTPPKTYDFEYVKLGIGWMDDNATTHERLQGTAKTAGFTLHWAAKGVGFGQLTFYKDGKKTTCETECMSKEFVRQAVEFWLASLKYKDK